MGHDGIATFRQAFAEQNGLLAILLDLWRWIKSNFEQKAENSICPSASGRLGLKNDLESDTESHRLCLVLAHLTVLL